MVLRALRGKRRVCCQHETSATFIDHYKIENGNWSKKNKSIPMMTKVATYVHLNNE